MQYSCKWEGCPYKTHYLISLHQHVLTHILPPSIPCLMHPKCTSLLATEKDLIFHILTNHASTPYKCGDINKGFSSCTYVTDSKEDMYGHMREHDRDMYSTIKKR